MVLDFTKSRKCGSQVSQPAIGHLKADGFVFANKNGIYGNIIGNKTLKFKSNQNRDQNQEF